MSYSPVRLSRHVGPRSLRVSFEFFPPKNAESEVALWESIERLAPFRPDFVSVTYGAGGSTRERTHNTVARIVRDTNLQPAAHLTCVGATKTEIDAVLRDFEAAGVRHIVALRGDPPGGVGEPYIPHPEGYKSTADLIGGIRAVSNFDISVSAYPEKHPESASIDADLDVLQALDDDPATRRLIAAAVAAEQVIDLLDRGVRDFHFYTMNRADLVYAICHLLGLRPETCQAAA
jgi:methylenetetrahydrofolate reductase (NADPH)